MKALLSLLLLVSITASAAQVAAPVAPNEIVRFATDGCSDFPNGYWRDCCTFHDFAYWKGGTLDQKIRADAALNVCIVSKGEKRDPIFRFPLAAIVFMGVFFGGPAEFDTPFRWGYGWKLDRGYQPLSPELQKLVDAQTPEDILSLKIEKLPINTKNYPSETGNYCIDELYRVFSRFNAENRKNLRFTAEHVRGAWSGVSSYAIRVEGEGCSDGEYTAIFGVHTDDLCTQMTSRDHPTDDFVGFSESSPYCPEFNAWFEKFQKSKRKN